MRAMLTLATAAILALAGAVATASPAVAETAPSAVHVGVTLKEMSIQLTTATIPAGPVVFDVTNTGTVEHEFVILRTDVPESALPENEDEPGKVAEIGHVDEIDPVLPGATVSLAVSLAPGTYVLVCNKPGHDMSGMHTTLTVTTPISATVKEMSITLAQKFAVAGAVTFSITNTGSTVHEFVVLRTDTAEGAIPASADEPGKAEEPGHVGEVEDIDPGNTSTLTLTLDAGKYVIICNMPGHYAAGMHTSFTILPSLPKTVSAAIQTALAARGVEDLSDELGMVDVNALLLAPGVVVTDLDRAAVTSGILPRAVGAGGGLLY